MKLTDTIGNTQLIDLTPFITQSLLTGVRQQECMHTKQWTRLKSATLRPDVSILAKCEYLNPTGSIKDRIVAYMVRQAEKSGHLKPGHTLIESTSGNTGAAVARIAAINGYKALLVIPDRVSREKQTVLRALGAEVQVAPHHASIDSGDHYINVAQQLAQSIPKSFYINQYYSPHNAAAHYHTTGPEIWNQTQGHLDVFISVAGSGGTVSGIGRYLKEKKSAIKIIAVDPIGSVYQSYFRNGILPDAKKIFPSLVEGAGEDHLVSSMDWSVIDDIVTFRDEDAFYTARWLAQKTGIFAGGSSGANIWAAIQLAQQMTQPTRIVTILPDSGMKYLSKLYSDTWMEAQGFY